MQYQRRTGQQPQVKKKRVFTPREEEPETASPHYTGHYAGLHPEDTPQITTANVRSHLPVRHTRPAYEPDELEAGSQIAAITRRYNGVPMPDGVLVRNGNEQIYFHKGAPPIQRAHRGQPQLTAPRKTDEIPVIGQRRKLRLHWLFFVGLVLLLMLLGYVGLNAFGSWWQNHQNDVTYGNPRTFQIDAVVGQGDSPAHPSHFISMNLNRHIVIVDIPGGDISKSVIYSGGVLVGDGQDLTPVTLSFSDVNGDGKPDMLVHVADQTIVFLNNGTKFVPPSNVVTGGSNPPVLGE
jgi:hypothetical protein